MKRTTRSWLTVMLAIAGATALCGAWAAEERVAVKSLPAAVTAAVKKQFPGAHLNEAVKETENGRLVYEVSIRQKGNEKDVALLADGKIIEVEAEISENDLPATIAQALTTAFPGARIREIEQITDVERGETEPSTYEILITTADGKLREVAISKDGQIVEDDEDDSGAEADEDDD